MKKYSHELKKYVTEAELELEKQRKLKRRESCKGGRPHDWIEVLPYGVEAGPTYQGVPEPYYDAEKAIESFTKSQYQKLDAIGIIVKRYKSFRNRSWRSWMCSVCHKQEHKEKTPA